MTTACLLSHRFVWKTKAKEVEGDDSVKTLSQRIPDLQNHRMRFKNHHSVPSLSINMQFYTTKRLTLYQSQLEVGKPWSSKRDIRASHDSNWLCLQTGIQYIMISCVYIYTEWKWEKESVCKQRVWYTFIEDVIASECEEVTGRAPGVERRWELWRRDMQIHGEQRNAQQTHMKPPLPADTTDRAALSVILLQTG